MKGFSAKVAGGLMANQYEHFMTVTLIVLVLATLLTRQLGV
jgi:hypothetical protein